MGLYFKGSHTSPYKATNDNDYWRQLVWRTVAPLCLTVAHLYNSMWASLEFVIVIVIVIVTMIGRYESCTNPRWDVNALELEVDRRLKTGGAHLPWRDNQQEGRVTDT